MAWVAAAMAWDLARSGSKGSEVKEGWWVLRMERVDFVLLNRSLALRDEEGIILPKLCKWIEWKQYD